MCRDTRYLHCVYRLSVQADCLECWKFWLFLKSSCLRVFTFNVGGNSVRERIFAICILLPATNCIKFLFPVGIAMLHMGSFSFSFL